MADRRARLLNALDTGGGHGLEIGPLYKPVALKDECDVSYVDIHFAKGLREYYATHPGTPIDEILEVDFALIEGEVTRSLAQATAPAAPFDWVVASHVIEHVPDLIGWLNDVAEVLVDGGKLSLAVPDRRYCFDARRPPTTVGQMLLAHHNRDARPSVRAVFDHYHAAVRVTPTEAWEEHPGPETTIFPLEMARDMTARSVDEGIYMDCHVWLFTPREFVQQLAVLAQLGHLDFTVAEIITTDVKDMEYFVVLQRAPRDIDDAARQQLLSDGFPLPEQTTRFDPGTSSWQLSQKEAGLVAAKRDALFRLRRVAHRMLRRWWGV